MVFDDSAILGKTLLKSLLKTSGIMITHAPLKDYSWRLTCIKDCAFEILGQLEIVGAGSVVTKDLPVYTVAVGYPCKVVKQRK